MSRKPQVINKKGKLRLKKDDLVKVIAGTHKGTVAKIIGVSPASSAVTLEGIGIIKRRLKPSQLNPRGGTKEIHKPLDASKVALVVNDKNKISRIGYKFDKSGAKVRVARALKDKEIK